MDAILIAKLLGGLVVLTSGAETLVRGASHLAAAWGLSPLIIGLTVVAYGTSAPELAVSLHASLAGNPAIAVANVVGANIFNVLCVLGICALMAPLVISRQLVRIDVPIMIGASLMLWGLAFDGELSWIDGIVLLITIVIYTVWSIKMSRKESVEVPEDVLQEFEAARAHRGGHVVKHLVLMIVGLAMLLLGAHWLVDGAVAVARSLGVSDVIVGLTVVAVGTSLPELTTSIVAIIRGQQDIAVGHIIGSNIFNILGIVGVSAVAAPDGLIVAPSMIDMDIPIMVVVALACLPIFFTGLKIVRWEGLIFLLAYVAYTAYLILDAYDHDGLHSFRSMLQYFTLPMAAIMVTSSAVKALRRREGRDQTDAG